MIAQKSPLEGMSIGTATTLMIRELPGLHTVDLKLIDTSTQAAVVGALGFDLPAKSGLAKAISVSDVDETYTLCLAPDWWLIVGFPEAEQKLLRLRSDDYHFSAVDVSGQRTTIELEGPKVCEVLAHLWEQDLREKSFPVGRVSQGLMAKASVIVYYIASLRYRVMVRSSYALHLWKALVDAAQEYL